MVDDPGLTESSPVCPAVARRWCDGYDSRKRDLRDVSRCVIAVVGSPNLQGKVCALCSCVVSPIPTKCDRPATERELESTPPATPLCIRGFTSGRGGGKVVGIGSIFGRGAASRVYLTVFTKICLRVALAKSFGSMKRRAERRILFRTMTWQPINRPPPPSRMASTPLPLPPASTPRRFLIATEGIKGRRRRRHDLSSSFKGGSSSHG
jgi:hypothetical protein